MSKGEHAYLHSVEKAEDLCMEHMTLYNSASSTLEEGKSQKDPPPDRGMPPHR